MTTLTVAAVQAAYVLMDREATVARVEALTTEAAGMGADLVVFPEVFVPGTPIWIDAVPIWDGDDKWFAALVDQAVVVPSETTDRLCAAARDAGVYLVVGINEREPTGSTIYNTVLYWPRTAVCSAGIASSCRRAPNARCGAWATGRRSTCTPHRWAGSAG
jgi:nitrilase